MNINAHCIHLDVAESVDTMCMGGVLMRRGFHRGRAAIAASRRNCSVQYDEAWLRQILARLSAQGIGADEKTDGSMTPQARALVAVALGRPPHEDVASSPDRGAVQAAHAVWRYWCQADDRPRLCGARDTRFSFYWTDDPDEPCPLEDLCATRRQDLLARST